MADLIIDDDLVQRLREIAEKENRPVGDVLRSMVEKYTPQLSSADEALLAMDGMFDDDITDLSSMTKDDVIELYRKKYADAD